MYKVITGAAKEIEAELNNLRKDWTLSIEGVTSSVDQVTVVLKIVGTP